MLRRLPGDLYYFLMTPVLALPGFRAFVPRKAGRTCPDPDAPIVLLLRPFTSERRYIISGNWVAPALWQFGQPVMPTDRDCSVWKRRPGYVVPDQPAWKRTMFGFDRVLGTDDWISEIPGLVEQANLIVVDVSDVRGGISQELDILRSLGAASRTLFIREDQTSASAQAGGIPAAAGAWSREIAAAMTYRATDAASLTALWEALVARAAQVVGVPMAEVPHPRPPARLTTNPTALISFLTALSSSGGEAAAGPGAPGPASD